MNRPAVYPLTLLLLLGSVLSVSAAEIGNLNVGGAIRANYVNGDYTPDGTDAAQRGDRAERASTCPAVVPRLAS